jgi:two-component system sensor histidine kinase AlgZ
MQPAATSAASGEREGSVGEFFIPDLCAAQPVLIMVLLAELLVFIYALASSSLPYFDWELLATSSLFVLWIVLLSAALLCWMRRIFSRTGLAVATAGSLLLVLGVTALSSQAVLLLYPQLTRGIDPSWWMLRNLLVAAVLTGIVLRNFYLQHQLRMREKLELQARLDSLRARMRPHFLFNTMNSIASLIMSRPRDAEQAVEDLSELFRASLQESRRPTTVADELHLCELYLGIEQLRLGDRLQVVWEIEGAVRQKPMPSLVLQPLVENAVYHGISRLPDGGLVTVQVELAGDSVRASVENPVPDDAGRADGHHMALSNIEQRLHALYGGEGRLQAGRSGDLFRVELQYPAEQPL